MNNAGQIVTVSVEDYLAGELVARHKHEYVAGFVYAKIGATNVHNRIATNVTGSLYTQLRGKPCQVFHSDTKVRVSSAHGTRFYYPDAMVACELNPESDTFQDQPVVIVEVISPSTRRTDENEKRESYQSIDSLQHYILIETESATVTVHQRTTNGFQRVQYAGLENEFYLPEIDCNLLLSDIFENVQFLANTADDSTADDEESA